MQGCRLPATTSVGSAEGIARLCISRQAAPQVLLLLRAMTLPGLPTIPQQHHFNFVLCEYGKIPAPSRSIAGPALLGGGLVMKTMSKSNQADCEAPYCALLQAPLIAFWLVLTG